jgi:hypothetical protein
MVAFKKREGVQTSFSEDKNIMQNEKNSVYFLLAWLVQPASGLITQENQLVHLKVLQEIRWI